MYFKWLAVLLLTFLNTSVLAQPRQLRVSLVDDAATTMGIAWTTDSQVSTIVRYGETSSYGLEQTGEAPFLAESIGYIHEVTLTGLAPDTTYHYSVGDGVEWSEDATFKTMTTDPCAPWRFIAMGDNRTQMGEGGHAGVSKNFPAILGEAADRHPDFILNSGDLVDDGAIVEQWIDYLDSTEPVAKSIPMFTAIGNHDDDHPEGDDAKYNKIFYLPRNDINNQEDYFVHRFMNAVIVVLSTQTFKGGSATDSRTFAQQAEFLDAALTQHSDATWKIVAYHHPTFTGGGFELLGFEIGHPPDEAGQNAVILPILDAHHVDFVITGHNHWYERFAPMVQGDSLDQGTVVPSPDDGTIHITTGGAGAYTMDFPSIPILNVCSNLSPVRDIRDFCSGKHHYVVFDIQGNNLSMETWSTTNQNVGTEEPALIDSLSYTKGGNAICPTVTPDGGVSTPDSAQPDTAVNPDAGQNDIAVADAAVWADTSIARDAVAADAVQADTSSVRDAVVAQMDSAVFLDTTAPAVDSAKADEVVPEGGCHCATGSHFGSGWIILFGLFVGWRLVGLRRKSRFFE